MVRYFLYIDEQTIDSFYNQLDNSYDLKKNSISKNRSLEGESKVSLKNIILGFLDGEGRIMSEFTRGSNEEIERSIKIENKIMTLIKIAKGNEDSRIDISNTSQDKQLVCGIIRVVECNMFLKWFSETHKKEINSYNDFLNYIDKNGMWNDIVREINYISVYGNGLNESAIRENWYINEEKIFSFIVINNTYPIIMDMSYKKITMTHSYFRSANYFKSLTEFNIIGLISKSNKIFSIKPLALWNIITTE